MARKAKRKAASARRQVPVAAPLVPPAGTDPAVRPLNRPGPRVGGDQTLVRAVEMSLAPGVATRGRGRNRFVLEGGDPAIPLDRVPHFLTDLRRIGVVAAVMVALLIAADFVVPALVR